MLVGNDSALNPYRGSVADAACRGWEVALVVRVLNVSEQLSAFADEVQAPAKEIARRAHPGGVDVGHGHHPPAQEPGYLARIDLVVLGFAAVDRSHVESMAQDESDPLALAQVCQPVPGEDALDGDSEILAVGFDRPQEGLWRGGHVAMEDHSPCCVEDAEVHCLGMKVDTAVVSVLFGVESHGSLLNGLSSTPRLPGDRVASGGAFISIKPLQRTRLRRAADRQQRSADKL